MGILPVSEWVSWNTSFGGPGAGNGPLSGPWYSTHKTQLLGVLLAAASNFLISVSLNIQKCSHLRLGCRTEPKPYYTSKLWWCGITLLGLGEVGNFIAYGFAPIALVAPLGCVSVIGLYQRCWLRKPPKRGAGILLTAWSCALILTTYNVFSMFPSDHAVSAACSLPIAVIQDIGIKDGKNVSSFVHQFSSGSAFISVLFLKKTMRAADILGGTLTVAGTYLLVTFAPNVPQELTARQIQNYLVSWPFLVYSILEIIIFCILLYFYKRKSVKHIVVLLMMVALLASLTVVAVKAVASMITLSAKGKMQLTYPVFYIMIVLMATSCVFQVKFLNQAMHLYEAREVVPINFVFFTTSAIISGVVFYREFQSAALLNVFMFLFGCLLSFLGVFVIARNKKEEHFQMLFIDCGLIPGKKLTGKIQPDSRSSRYGTLNNEDDSVKSQS